MKKRVVRFHKRVLQVLVVLIIVMFFTKDEFLISDDIVDIEDIEVPGSNISGHLIRETAADTTVMPDKYNTGAKGELFVAGIGEEIQGALFVYGNKGTANLYDFKHNNASYTLIKDVDFSNYSVVFKNEYLAEKGTKIKFENCIFKDISTAREESPVVYEFKNCTIANFRGANSTFENCKFGGNYKDAIVPFLNVTVKDSFICDMISNDLSGTGAHTDGTQIYGVSGVDVTNVHYENCRFELPAALSGSSTNTVNACIMLQLEYSNGKDISFENCTVNGGGYSIYATNKNECTYQNVQFKNISVGAAWAYGPLCPNVSDGVSIDSMSNVNSLYIGSVWKKDGNTYISVTNDTSKERKLSVFTDGELLEYQIGACQTGEERVASYDLYPFDIPICIEKDVDYLVCFDSTNSSSIKQIRFVNWHSSDVYISDSAWNEMCRQSDNLENKVLLQGACGKAINYTLDERGVLNLTGIGATYDYHSQNRAPWYDEYRSEIREVIISEGITTIGNQMFRDCVNLEKITLPNTLESIGVRAFGKCVSLLEIQIPVSVKEICGAAFVNDYMQTVEYAGTEADWKNIEIGESNSCITDKVEFMTDTVYDSFQEKRRYILVGTCENRGGEVRFTLDENGLLEISGIGKMADYHSGNLPPWWKVKDKIKKVVINEGVTSVGNYSFKSCNNISDVDLPTSLVTIGSNAFQQCKNLKRIYIPMSTKKIGKYAFHNSAVTICNYQGTNTMWNNIIIEIKNNEIANTVFCSR